jgi:hypothetical protein
MDRRSFLSALGVSGAIVSLPNWSDKEKPSPTVQLYPNMVGCIGVSKNQNITTKLLQELSWHPESEIRRSSSTFKPIWWAKRDNVKAVYCGTLPELYYYKKSNNYENAAGMLLSHYLMDQDRLNVGIKEFTSKVNYGEYFSIIAEDNTVWFMTDGGMFYVVDLRKTLGQIVFFPNVESFRESAKDTEIRSVVPVDTEIIEMPQSACWMLRNDDEWMIKKYKITKSKFYTEQDTKKDYYVHADCEVTESNGE